ncbi:DnaJ domain-containing protein [Prauserella oleivorans]
MPQAPRVAGPPRPPTRRPRHHAALAHRQPTRGEPGRRAGVPPRDHEGPYVLLGVAPTASDREIAAAYRRRVRELHPDASGGDAERSPQ